MKIAKTGAQLEKKQRQEKFLELQKKFKIKKK